MPEINPLVVDLSHWDPANDYQAVKRDGVVGVIYKATEGTGYTDPTYVAQQQAAKMVGLKWGAYHFATAADVTGQIDNFLTYASPDPDELFCLDWEDYGTNTMSLENVKIWIAEVERVLKRPEQCVLYSGNTAKEALGDRNDKFLGARRLWLCQYGTSPKWQKSWERYWLWQYTDGQVGPTPHSISGIGPCDINSYDFEPERLAAEWATGDAELADVTPPEAQVVSILVQAPHGITVKVRTVSGWQGDEPIQEQRMLREEREGR